MGVLVVAAVPRIDQSSRLADPDRDFVYTAPVGSRVRTNDLAFHSRERVPDPGEISKQSPPKLKGKRGASEGEKVLRSLFTSFHAGSMGRSRVRPRPPSSVKSSLRGSYDSDGHSSSTESTRLPRGLSGLGRENMWYSHQCNTQKPHQKESHRQPVLAYLCGIVMGDVYFLGGRSYVRRRQQQCVYIDDRRPAMGVNGQPRISGEGVRQNVRALSRGGCVIETDITTEFRSAS